MTIETEVVVPVHAPIWFEPIPGDWVTSIFGEVLECTELVPVEGPWDEKSSLRIRELRLDAETHEIQTVWLGTPLFTYRFLRFECSIEVDMLLVREGLRLANPKADVTDWVVDSLVKQVTAESVSQYVAHVLMASQIAKPGALYCEDRFLFVDGDFVRREEGFFLGFVGALKQSKRQEWPPLPGIAVRAVLEWLMAIDGFLECEPKGPAGRAISALSNLTMRPMPMAEDPVGLMWCLVALESLYGEGNTNLRKQIVEKSRIFLGEPAEFKKEVGRMYDFRSRFIHGDLDFPMPYQRTDFDELGFGKKVSTSVQLALALVIATVMRMVQQNRHSLQFEYSLARGTVSGV
jgi:hypothetical protein